MKFWSSLQGLTISQVQHDIGKDVMLSTVIMGTSVCWLQLWISLVQAGKVDTNIARKIIHTGSAPLFLLLWPFYSSSGIRSRLIAALIPTLTILRLLYSQYVGGSREPSQIPVDSMSPLDRKSIDLIDAISRGNRKESARGPLIYSAVLLIATLIWFRESPIGIIAVMQMAFGDGIAGIVGRIWGKSKWKFSPDKSYLGSTTFMIAAFTGCVAMLQWFQYFGLFELQFRTVVPRLLLITILCALVELTPSTYIDDNIVVPGVGALLANKVFSV